MLTLTDLTTSMQFVVPGMGFVRRTMFAYKLHTNITLLMKPVTVKNELLRLRVVINTRARVYMTLHNLHEWSGTELKSVASNGARMKLVCLKRKNLRSAATNSTNLQIQNLNNGTMQQGESIARTCRPTCFSKWQIFSLIFHFVAKIRRLKWFHPAEKLAENQSGGHVLLE